MAKGLLGRKVGMTQIYDESGTVIPVTVIQAGPCHVLQVRTPERDGYEAVQLGFLDKPRQRARRSERGHVARLSSKRSKRRADAGIELSEKPDCEPKQFIREIRGPVADFEHEYTLPKETGDAGDDEGDEPKKVEVKGNVGAQITVRLFDGIAAVDVTGTSKGRGFAGVMKRHNYSGQRASHGVKKVHRHPGSTGMSAFPSRVFKGRKMAGQYGNARVTARNLKVVRVDPENNLLVVRGAVPGPNGGLVIIRETNKLG